MNSETFFLVFFIVKRSDKRYLLFYMDKTSRAKHIQFLLKFDDHLCLRTYIGFGKIKMPKWQKIAI